MASTKIELTANTWTEVGSSDGSIRHQSGKGSVVYLESASAPSGFDGDSPVMEVTIMGDSFPVYSVDGSVYAYAIDVDASIVYTPVAGA